MKTIDDKKQVTHFQGLWLLSPLAVFFLLYVGFSLCMGDFYKMPLSVAFVAAAAWAFLVFRRASFQVKLDIFSRGAAHRNIMMMVWIFLLAGAFAQSAREMGAVDAAVNLTLYFMPPGMLLVGIFLAACLISFSVGTSVGTIVALMSVALGLAARTGMGGPLVAGAVIGGAFFGDNLSFISDTTIAATRTQGCTMRDKFYANFAIVLPAALLGAGIYTALGWSYAADVSVSSVEWYRVFPYLVVLFTALAGVHVMVVLTLGVISTGLLSLSHGCSFEGWLGALGQGMVGMGELIIVTLLAGGLLGLIRHFGGIAYIISLLSRLMRGPRMASLAIALMVSVANLCTANNTVAILTVGDIARHVADRFGISPARSASLLDTFSCLVQGVLPYGAQLLMGAQLAGLNALDIIPYMYYPALLGVSALLFIVLRPIHVGKAGTAR